MRLQIKHITLIALILLSSFTIVQESEINSDIKLITHKTNFEAGSVIKLEFASSIPVNPMMYCTNSYGSTIIQPVLNQKKLTYFIPKHISNKKGIIAWKLIHDHNSISGQLTITAKIDVTKMETYIGPPSIQSGGTDYTMLIVIPTDNLDNPLPEDTKVNAKYQFLKNEENNTIKTKHLIAYKNIYSKTQSGRILVSSECLNTNSKEFTVNVLPAIPTAFSIYAKQPHHYADGNQITTFETSILIDQNNNVVSDGTFVNFVITNENGNILKTYGTTINGVATAKMIHPDYAAKWKIKAFVTGMAESESILLNFEQAITDFEVSFSEHKRDIEIGPLKSFMGQMIPDGLLVKLQLNKGNDIIYSTNTTSFEGFAHFNLKPDNIKNDDYTILIQAAGIEKIFKNVTLW